MNKKNLTNIFLFTIFSKTFLIFRYFKISKLKMHISASLQSPFSFTGQLRTGVKVSLTSLVSVIGLLYNFHWQRRGVSSVPCCPFQFIQDIFQLFCSPPRHSLSQSFSTVITYSEQRNTFLLWQVTKIPELRPFLGAFLSAQL